MKIIIAGAYGIGTHLAMLFTRMNHEIVLVDESEERLAYISNDYDLLTYCGFPSSFATMRETEVKNAGLYIAVTLNEDVNLNACCLAKTLGAACCVAKVNNYEFIDVEHQRVYKSLGIDTIIYPEYLAGKQIATGLKMSWVRQRVDFEDSNLVMLGIKLREEATILDTPLKELFSKTDPYHLVAIRRNNETIIPGGNDCLKLYDTAWFMTMKEYIPSIRRLVGKDGYVDVKNVIVMGGGDTAIRAIEQMPSHLSVRVFEKDEKRCEELRDIITKENVMIIHADGRDTSTLLEEGIRNTQAFVAATGNAETNILACLTAKKYGVRKTVAIVENMDYATMAVNLDIGTIVNKKALAATQIYQIMLNNSNMSNLSYLMTANADIVEFVVTNGAKVTRKPVKDLDLPKGCTIGGLIHADGEGKLVSGDTVFLPGDKAIVFCYNVKIDKVEKFFC
ncbi:MAG: Trk system potassium transporter TrkA [Bacteroidaceae bacterium]|nr:Trk system potassium transporter TrkA [Bacteroidaceae bacterium]